MILKNHNVICYIAKSLFLLAFLCFICLDRARYGAYCGCGFLAVSLIELILDLVTKQVRGDRLYEDKRRLRSGRRGGKERR